MHTCIKLIINEYILPMHFVTNGHAGAVLHMRGESLIKFHNFIKIKLTHLRAELQAPVAVLQSAAVI